MLECVCILNLGQRINGRAFGGTLEYWDTQDEEMIHAIYVHADIIPVRCVIVKIVYYLLHHTLSTRTHIESVSWRTTRWCSELGFCVPLPCGCPNVSFHPCSHNKLRSKAGRVYTTIAKNSWFPLQESYSSGREPSKYLLRNRSDVAVLQHAIAIPNQQFLHRHSFLLGIFCGNHILPIHIPLL